MRLSIAVLLFVLALGQISRGAPLSSNAVPVTHFDEHAKLTPEQVRTVIKLAQQCGMIKVAEVGTYNIHPGPDFCILVKSPEKVQSRKISYETLSIDYSAWRSGGWISEPGAKHIGEFSVDRTTLYKAAYTVFEVDQKSVRVKLGKELPLALADKIVAALNKRKIRFANDELRKKFDGFDFSTLSALGGNPVGGKFSSCFTPGTSTWVFVEFSFADGEILILSTSTMAA